MKKSFAGTVAIALAAVLLFSVKAEAISAESAILTDADTGRVLYAENADRKSLIASVTKIMTAYVVCTRCNVLDRYRIPKQAVGIEGSSMYLREGEVLTVQELLYGLMLQSGNDAATALAIYCGGTVEGFVALMNDEAVSLGLENTHFDNPHGLDSPEHYSTAADLAKLTAAAMKNPIFAATVGTKSVTIGRRSLQNHNRLLWQIAGADGVKTGYTKAAGRTLVSTAVRNGRRLIAVTLNDGNDWADHAALMEKGFGEFTLTSIVEPGSVVGAREIEGGQRGTAELVCIEGFSYPLAKGETVRCVAGGNPFVYAPVVSGQDAGTLYFVLGDTVIGQAPLVYGKTVEMERTEEKTFLEKIKSWFSHGKNSENIVSHGCVLSP